MSTTSAGPIGDDAAATSLRLLAYNIDSVDRERVTLIEGIVRTLDPHVVAFTEANDRDLVARLADRLGMHFVWERGSGDRHVATLSRFAITESRIYRTPPVTQAVLETRIELPCGPLTIFSAHLLPYLLLPFEIRRWQAVGRLLQTIRARGVGAHLIVGDLNSVAPGDRVLHWHNPVRMQMIMAMQLFVVFRPTIRRLLRAGYVDCFRSLNPDAAGFTFMTRDLTTRYDYVMAEPSMAARLRSCRVVDDLPDLIRASDHFPLVAEFDVSGPA